MIQKDRTIIICCDNEEEMKQLATSAGITAVCGITEPAMYGVNLKLKKPLIPVMIAGGAAGLYMGLCGVGNPWTTDPLQLE